MWRLGGNEMKGGPIGILLLFSCFEAISKAWAQPARRRDWPWCSVECRCHHPPQCSDAKGGARCTKQFPGNGSFIGRIVSTEVVDDENIFNVAHGDDGNEEELDEGGIMGLLGV